MAANAGEGIRVRRLGIVVILVFLGVIIIGVPGEIILHKRRNAREGVRPAAVKRFLFQTPGSMEEWDVKGLSRNRTDYSLAEYKGRKCVKADSRGSAAIFYYKQQLSLEECPHVSWDWVVERFPVRESEEALQNKEEFDFAAQVYVLFQSRFFLRARAIQYVWAEKLPVGTVSKSPYTRNVRIMVLESGISEGWKHEDRNIADDFRALFGEELKKDISAIAFMTDSDSTGSSAVAYYGNIALGAGSMVDGQTEKKGDKRIADFFRWLFGFRFWDNNERRSHQTAE